MSSRHRIVSNARRLQNTISRVEQQPYDFTSPTRAPRLTGQSNYLCCQVSSTLAAGTGTFPNITPGKVTNQTIYMPSQNPSTGAFSLTAIALTNSTVLNYSATSFATGKFTRVVPSGIANVFCTVVQDC